MKDDSLFIVWLGAVIFFSGMALGHVLTDKEENLKQTIELQKQTIYRLNNQLSKMDTLHDQCFKVSEIQKLKK